MRYTKTADWILLLKELEGVGVNPTMMLRQTACCDYLGWDTKFGVRNGPNTASHALAVAKA